MSAVNKIGNEYAHKIGTLYDRTPKAVFAAIAISLATTGGDYLERAEEFILDEWQILHENHIVPQKPPKVKAVRP